METAGLAICLPVRDELRAEAVEIEGGERELRFLHYQTDAWRGVEDVEDSPPGRLCATVRAVSPFAVGYPDKKPKFPEDMKPLPPYPTGQAVNETLPFPDGDWPITYTLTPALPAGLTYTPPAAEAKHGGTITGTPTTPKQETYTLTATDVDKDTASMTFTIEVKPGIQSRDLGLVLAGVGRTLASDAVEILGGRFGSAPASRLQVTLGGQVLRLTEPQASAPSSPSSPPPSPLAGEGRGEGEVLQGEGSVVQSEAQESAARPVGSSPWQQATGLALGVARALGVTINTPSPHSPSPLAGAGRG